MLLSKHALNQFNTIKELEMLKRLNKHATMSDYVMATMFINIVVIINVF